MQIEAVSRSCAVGSVAEAAVASVGGGFAVEVERAAEAKGVSVGDYTVTSVKRFARAGRESEMRAVASIMAASQVPVLAAIECIVTLGLAREPNARR